MVSPFYVTYRVLSERGLALVSPYLSALKGCCMCVYTKNKTTHTHKTSSHALPRQLNKEGLVSRFLSPGTTSRLVPFNGTVGPK